MHNHSYLKIFIVIIVLQQLIFAQSWSEFKDDAKFAWNTTENLGKTMFQPSTQDLKIFTFSTAMVFSSYFLDQSIRNFSQRNQTEFLDNVFFIDDYYGDRKIMVAGPLLLYATGFFTGNNDIKEMGLHSGQAILYAGVITAAIKEMVGRSRPSRNEGPEHFKPFAFREESRSFFSGHASVTFAASTVMANEVDNLVWKVFWYGAASWVVGARIYHDRHWFSDVFAGALVGYAIGNFVSREATRNDKKIKLSTSMAAYGKNDFLINISIPLGN